MELELPDGTVLEFPEGTTREAALRFAAKRTAKTGGVGDAIRHGLATATPYTAAAFSPELLGSLEGMYEGAKDLSRGLSRVVSRPLKSIGIGGWDKAIDEEQARADARNKELYDSTPGAIGKFTGDVALSLTPVGAPGKAVQGAELLRRVAAQGSVLGAMVPSASAGEQASNIGIGTAVSAGAQKGGDMFAAWMKGRKALSPADRLAVEHAQERGLELSPAQQTGSPWKRLVEAAFRRIPSTAGREATAARSNQELWEGRVRDIGGDAMPQHDVAAAAREGYKKGLASEEGRLGAAYGRVLDDKQISLEPMREPLEEVRQAAKLLPEDQQGGPALQSLNVLLGDPNYVPKSKHSFTKPPVNAEADDIVVAIRKLGGINPADPYLPPEVTKAMPFGGDPRLGPVWGKPTTAGSTSGSANRVGGLGLDEMAARLHERGYISDPSKLDEVVDKLVDSYGEPSRHFSIYREITSNDPLANAVEKLTKTLSPKSPSAPKAGFIRDQSPVEGRVAQRMRSRYGSKSQAAYDRGGELEVGDIYRDMKKSLDTAINDALPEAERGQFAAINKRYGIFAALEDIDEKSQHQFLQSLYSGSKSPDRFYTFLGMAPDGEFAKVAKGFLDDLVEKATAEGNISGNALGKATDKANKQAMKYMGGEAGQELWKLGQIGSRVLPDVSKRGDPWGNLLTQYALTGGAGGAFGAYSDDSSGVGGFAKGVAGGLLAPKLLQSGYYGGFGKDQLANALRDYGPILARALAMQRGAEK